MGLSDFAAAQIYRIAKNSPTDERVVVRQYATHRPESPAGLSAPERFRGQEVSGECEVSAHVMHFAPVCLIPC